MQHYDPKKVMNNEQLEEMAEDDLDFDDDDEFLKQYRNNRMQQMQAAASKPRFGSVIEISKPEWEMEVQRAPPGVFVLICLYQN